ncbi:MAG: bifunctional glutamate N-acetyltransferase/amino-acid acetyltransferase ArgJ [Rhodospirillales bacterium]|nr:bifunctional glutamate N-acetyltransferase/amino-acid acetyltransferase ArgJ [Rhodospirillales bacterium]
MQTASDVSAKPGASPLAPARFPEMPPVRGLRLATAAAGLRYRDRDDVLLVVLEPGSAVAGVFTRSQTAAAPVLWCRQILGEGQARGLVVNAGNANAFTGAAGDRAVQQTAVAAAGILGCAADQVFVASTGVIGEAPAVDRLVRALPGLHNGLAAGGWEAAARAIATTDTFAKGSTRTTEIEGRPVSINGIAKGAGMIAPDMATMLAFVFTDAAIAPAALQRLVEDAAARSFNCITVDGDTSTNDTLLAFATAAAGHAPVHDPADPRIDAFRVALGEVMVDLATQVVRDGEGARKFITITVGGAESDAAARVIGLSIANSPLVKTAVAGEDANWGRIVMAIGKAGERIDRDRLAISVGGFAVAADGGPVPGYDEGPVARHMKGAEVEIAVDVGVGSGVATVWTCDLTHDYIDINASYRS